MAQDLPIETQRFKQLRQELSLTQQAFSEVLHIKGSIADIERGKTKLPGAAVARLLQTYNINPLWLYGESDQKHLELASSVLPKVVTLDGTSNENIAMVNVKASAGYAHNLQDTEWYDALPAFHLPLPEYRNASFRAFQVQGDSMLPVLQPGEWVIARAEESLAELTESQVYVVVLVDTVVVKKIQTTASGLHLISLNALYPPIEVKPQEIREVWRVTAKITTNFDQPATSLDDLTREMREGFVSLKSLLLKE
ncbi:helix-turn-helix domain-containing protein [Flavobacterium sp. MAH-1]|uniref:Helix-turn-helix domain-containing protein n=1 Tax=Flavobacterium agri TaxID=2743471 RepID=A0A7Y9C5I9_9FLAO|nr:S24 family peptidase [Flavobacterium agri]NUY81031.1 helix-turn-helix domain-containing protein [Flavobacterium agri]NYA71055.1 helix-turn-helix domain-containing protein [Flavobacterium agri]